MWKVKKISARNLCSFRNFDWEIPQGVATIICGNNLDNDSQGSNGSGKSALIEALAIGLTGSFLRDVRTVDDMINDTADSCEVCIGLEGALGTLEVRRLFDRKNPQKITITRNGESVVLSSVAEYDKYVLETVGVRKSDVFSSFILSERTYVPFLSAPDREKKELINRFSNGVLVDKAIAGLDEDIFNAADKENQAHAALSRVQGSVEATRALIEEAESKREEEEEQRLADIKRFKVRIETEEAEVRRFQEYQDQLEADVEGMKPLANEWDSWLENNTEPSFDSAMSKAKEIFTSALMDFNDWERRRDMLVKSMKEEEDKLESASASLGKASLEARNLHEAADGLKAAAARTTQKMNDRLVELDGVQAQLENDIEKSEASLKKLADAIYDLDCHIGELRRQQAGVIECPECAHRWNLSTGENAESIKAKLKEAQDKFFQAEHLRVSMYEGLTELRNRLVQTKKDKDTVRDEIRRTQRASDEAASKAVRADMIAANYKARYDSAKTAVDQAGEEQKNLAFRFIDYTRHRLVDWFNDSRREIQSIIHQKSGAEAMLKMSRSGLTKAEEASTPRADALQETLEKYKKELEEATAVYERAKKKADELESQRQLFDSFKAYLANTRIEALAVITNGFLEEIGSDIRISMSGYTTGKGGKTRERISVSLLRNGEDAGCFGKFSKGERARVNLANILALRKLVNLDAPDGAGLDLLVLDEILEACDEEGLASVFQALNQLSVTSLIVSHGNVAENYEYKLTVNKKNGESYL